MYKDATVQEIDDALQSAQHAFLQYRKLNLQQRADFLFAIGNELSNLSQQLIDTAARETHLEKSRLQVELKRTIFQLTSYGEACAEGTWLDIRIDTGDPQRTPPKPDLRKMLVPLGPVVVFGASNFPFAYSTAGGDTACALAAGCPVIIKAHPAHAETSELVANAVKDVAVKMGLPEGIFIHIHGSGFEVGRALVQHPLTRAVGFTGSFDGGKALFDLANQRPVPIPVFSEMGSVNPVFILPEKLKSDHHSIAEMYALSITQSAGQFCTNPGVLIATDQPELESFIQSLGERIRETKPVKMLHQGIARSFHSKRNEALHQKEVVIAAETLTEAEDDESIPTLAITTGSAFLKNPVLHKEIFGPYSILVKCSGLEEMLEVAKNMEGQLTTTLMATEQEVNQNQELVAVLQDLCGRFIMNGVPTGVEVALAMHHGGPFPATTDSRFTAVGADGIKRFARPLCFQNWSDELLPPELQNNNPLNLWRTINNQLTKNQITTHS